MKEEGRGALCSVESILSTIPAELAAEIFSNLTINDVGSLLEAMEGNENLENLRGECVNRCSVEKYLKVSLGLGKDFVEAMSRNFVYLSGPAALEFFVPGSTTIDSSLDLYIHREKKHISSFLRSTESIGFTWYTPIEELNRYLDVGIGFLFTSVLIYKKMMTVEYVAEIRERGFCFIEDFKDDGTQEKRVVSVKVSKKNITVSTSHIGSCYRAGLCRVIRGHFATRSKHTKVQLMVEDKPNTLTFRPVFRFHSSCMQAFITAHGFCHLYGEMASKKQTYHWYGYCEGCICKKSVAEHTGKGFSMKSPPNLRTPSNQEGGNKGGKYTFRCVTDELSITKTDCNALGAPDQVVDFYSRCISRTKWIETMPGTVLHTQKRLEAIDCEWTEGSPVVHRMLDEWDI